MVCKVFELLHLVGFKDDILPGTFSEFHLWDHRLESEVTKIV